jgi:signal transduction histidine kinase
VFAEQFQPAAGKSAFGLSAKTYWIRMKITNQSAQEQWVLRLSNSVVDHFDIYMDDEKAGIGKEVQINDLHKDHYWSYSVEPGEKDKFTEKIYDKVLFITRFIDDLFMLSRFDESMAYDVVEEVQAKEWINREFEILTEDIRMTGHLCEYRLLGKANPAMTIDQHGIRRVLSNLIHNACKFSPLGSKVELEAILAENEVRFSVRDYGEGIGTEYLGHIFERNNRAGQSNITQGNGLGLSIAKEIIVYHGGEITVESEMGKGSCFYFSLPVARKEE